MAGAPRPDDLAGALRDAGFEQVIIETKPASREFIKDWLPGSGAEDYVVSANVSAFKPAPVKPAPVGVAATAGTVATGAAAFNLAEAGAIAAATAKKRSAAREKWAQKVGLESAVPPAPAPLPPPGHAVKVEGCGQQKEGCCQEPAPAKTPSNQRQG